MEKNYLFKAEKVNKSFGTTHALVDVDIAIAPGEIRGLIGENGSGKSTFSSICAGIQRADSGVLNLLGEGYNPNGTIDAMNRGVSMVVQEQGTINKVSVAANLFFGEEQQFVKCGVLNVKKMNKEALNALHSIGVEHIEPDAMIDSFTFEDRKLVELARALYKKPKLWIVDETTTALTINGREILYKLMRRIRDEGSSVLFISHDIEEIVKMCDSITILRDGVLAANLQKEEFDVNKIKQLMIGRTISGDYYRQDNDGSFSEEVVLELKNVTCGILKDITVQLHRGEILGVGGLSDCGMHELGKVFFGLLKPEKGEVVKDGTSKVESAAWSVENGIAYVSKNRDKESMMTLCSIKDNICLPSLKKLAKNGLITKKSEKDMADEWTKNLEVKAESIEKYCNSLSGGNKQKIVLAKWLAKGSDIMILDCPTRGIDIGTKASIYKLIEKLKKSGKSIILISEEMPELIGMSDRVVILKDGIFSGEFMRIEEMTEEKLIHKMI